MLKKIDTKINKKFFSIENFDNQKKDKNYWLSKKPSERFEATELMRQINYGSNYFSSRLQRVLAIIKQ